MGNQPRSVTQLSGVQQTVLEDSFGSQVPPPVAPMRPLLPMSSFPTQGDTSFGVTSTSSEQGQSFPYDQLGLSYMQGASFTQATGAARTLSPDQLRNTIPGNPRAALLDQSILGATAPQIIESAQPAVVTEIDRVNALGQVVERDFVSSGGQFQQVIAQASPSYQTASPAVQQVFAAPLAVQQVQAAPQVLPQVLTNYDMKPFPTGAPLTIAPAGHAAPSRGRSSSPVMRPVERQLADDRIVRGGSDAAAGLLPYASAPARGGSGSFFAEDSSNMAAHSAPLFQPGQAILMDNVANEVQVTQGPDFRSAPLDPFFDPFRASIPLMQSRTSLAPAQTLPPNETWHVANRSVNQQPPDDYAAAGKIVTGTGDGELGFSFFMYGFLVFVMLVMIPVWDGIALLKDPVWMFMAGDVLPKVLIVCVACVPILFLITGLLLKSCSRRGAATQHTMFGASLLFILLIGSILVTISQPMTEMALWSKQQFLNNCETGPLTRPLYMEYKALQKLRKDSACAALESVEKCSGFQQTPSSIWLQKFETYLQCAGFCYYPKILKEATNTSQPVPSQYPPALFTDKAFQGSCSAMAARDMESFVSDMSNQLLYEGFFLIGAAILQGFVMMFAGSDKQDLINRKKQEYGTTGDYQYATSGTFEPAPLRHRTQSSRV